MSDSSYKGSCFCGAVELTVTGKPEAMGYCHCSSCRSWAAAPVNAFSLWKPESVVVTRGEEQVGVYKKTERSLRQYCRVCGGHLMTMHPHWDLVDVYAATISGFGFDPQVHVNYQERVLAMRDGLPKMRDFPAEMGGSGETVPE
ncbi:MAG TPA: GFA family protein [Kofleriaceae bacterium]|nr:GFA family protein [Kofleriaceae bacterium]